MNPFDVPPERWVSPSLNRVRLAGPAIPAELEGTAAYDILSTAALRAAIRASAPALEIPPELPDEELLGALAKRFTAAGSPVRAAAGAIAAAYGRGLAYLLLTLHHAAHLPAGGNTLRAAVRADWQERHWQFWSQMESAAVGGGLVAGRLGQEMLPAARATLQGAAGSAPPVSLELAEWPRELALLGAARYAPTGCRAALAFDFGATAVKRAVAIYEGEYLAQVAQFASRPSPCGDAGPDGAGSSPAAGQLEQMAHQMAAAWQAAHDAGFRPEPVFCAAISTYLYRDQPYPQEAGSCYGRLQKLGRLPALLAEALAGLLGVSVRLRLVHDGTAAASVYAGVPRRVVITLGTAIGHGFPPPARGLRPLSRAVEVASLGES